MKRHPVHTLLCLIPLALTLASCEKVEVVDEAPADGETTTVRILARAASPSDDLYPLRLYAFTNDGTCAPARPSRPPTRRSACRYPKAWRPVW